MRVFPLYYHKAAISIRSGTKDDFVTSSVMWGGFSEDITNNEARLSVC